MSSQGNIFVDSTLQAQLKFRSFCGLLRLHRTELGLP